jgi:hypothetical protein
MIKIAEVELLTDDPVYQKGNYNRWKHRFSQQTVKLPYKNSFDIGKVYVYLMNGKTPVCYYVANIEKFMSVKEDTNKGIVGYEPELMWIEMNPDLAIGKVKESYQAGVISFKL